MEKKKVDAVGEVESINQEFVKASDQSRVPEYPGKKWQHTLTL